MDPIAWPTVADVANPFRERPLTVESCEVLERLRARVIEELRERFCNTVKSVPDRMTLGRLYASEIVHQLGDLEREYRNLPEVQQLGDARDDWRELLHALVVDHYGRMFLEVMGERIAIADAVDWARGQVTPVAAKPLMDRTSNSDAWSEAQDIAVDEWMDQYKVVGRLEELREREPSLSTPKVSDEVVWNWLDFDLENFRPREARLTEGSDASDAARETIWNSGDAGAIYEEGMFLLYGEQRDKTQKELPVQWLKRAAELGSMYAMLELSRCYFAGRGVHKNDKMAIQWHRKALNAKWNSDREEFNELLGKARQGNAEACYEIGLAFRQGAVIEADQETAFAWFEQAAELGLRDGVYMCFDSWLRGVGVPQHFEMTRTLYGVWEQMQVVAASEEARNLFEQELRSAEEGDSAALARLEEQWEAGLSETRKRAFEGDPEAQFEMAMERLREQGSADSEVISSFEKSAKQEHGEAQFMLGIMYFFGELGVERDEKLGHEYLAKAARCPYLLFLRNEHNERHPTGIDGGPALFSFDAPFMEFIEDVPHFDTGFHD